MGARDGEEPGFLGRLTFWWVNGVVRQAKRGEITEEHLPLPRSQCAEANFAVFQEQWARELKLRSESTEEAKEPAAKGARKGTKGPSLARALWRIYWREIALAGLLKLCWSVLVILGAFFFVRSLLQYVDPKVVSPYDSETAGIILVVCFFLDAWLLGLALQRMGDLCMRTGIKVRAALTSTVAKKALAMASVKTELAADIVSFVSTDIQKVFDGIQQMHYLWTAPIEALTILALLTYLTRIYALPGYVVVFAVLLLQYYAGYVIAKLKYKNKERVGARVALAQEVLPAMKLVKYYCWEQFFTKEFNKVRSEERPTQRRLILVRASAIGLVFLTPPLTAFITFTAYEFMVGRLTADLTFPTLSLFNILRFPLVVLPKAIRSASEAITSLQRLEEFLLLPIDHREAAAAVSELTSPGVLISNAEFAYKEAKDAFVLSVPRFEARPGEVVGVAGRVGSGKTSLVNAILGHIEGRHMEGRQGTERQGTVSIKGSIAYVRQFPWLQNISCRDNILFGEAYDEGRYQQTVEACALKLDFDILGNGDQTLAGLRGINLSGGQRQRLNLARAVYSDADIMLLDSPLSAVDYHTSGHIFEHCIRGMLRDKTVVLVTHNQDLLPRCDKVAIMDEGRMVYFGPFSREAVQRHLPSGKALGQVEASKDKDKDKDKEDEVKAGAGPGAGAGAAGAVQKGAQGKVLQGKQALEGVVIPGEEESSSTDFRIPMFTAMRKWWLAGGLWLGIASLLIYCTAQTTRQITDYWIRQWVSDSLGLYPSSTTYASTVYALSYMGITIAFGIMVWLRGFTFFSWTRNASNNFFQQYVGRTFGAPLAFFLNNPVGDLINVYSKDQDVMDENLPETLHFTAIYGIILVTTAVTVCVVIPLFSIFFGALVLVSCGALWVYLPPATKLKVASAERNGALTGLISEALEGVDVIQAFGKQEYFVREADNKLDAYHRFFFNSESLSLWLSLSCDFFGAVLVLSVSTFAILQKSTLGAANVGLAFSNVIQMLVFYTWVIRGLADTFSFWGSVERVSGLALNTPNEADLAPPEIKPDETLSLAAVDPNEWAPSVGRVRFENVWMRYRHNLPWALKGVSFEFEPREKIGVVGRTGSGKSTLLLVLYRMFEAGAGRIIYDAVDIAQLGREKLRRSLSVIPQEPLMFSGTLRANLDPYAEHGDAELWMALEQTGLKEHAESLKGGLDAPVDGMTSEWSLGQKQLLCLARAALTKVPVLCLDEATAAMDPQTEQLVIRTIEKLFEERTIITIAHRLDVVITGTRILVMDQGEALELDTPDALLSKKGSMFSQLVDKSGPSQAGALRHMAKEMAERKGSLT